MQTHAQPLMQRQAPRQSLGSWARNTSLTAPRQLAPLRSLPHPQPQYCIQSRARRSVTVAAASHADDFGSRLRRGTASRLKQAAEQIEDSGRRAAKRIDRTLNLQEQGRRAQAAVKGSSAWLDSQLRVRKRLELLGDTVRRDLPKWRRQLGKFNDSKIGQLFWVAALVYSIYTGFFWTLVFSFLRIVFLASWLLPLLLIFSMRQFNSQMAAAQAQQRAATAQQATRRNPFGRPAWGASPFSQPGAGRRAPSKPGPDFTQQGGGPIIDAEFDTIDDGDQ